MSYYRLPETLQHKVRAYYEYLWINQKHFGSASLLKDGDMSVSLRREITLFLYKDVVRKVPFFAESEDDYFLARVCDHLREKIYMPGEYIIREGEIGSEMYILGKGFCEVLNAHGQHMVRLRAGAVFGEVALIYESRRTASVKAEEMVEVSVLDAVDMSELMEEFPDLRATVRSKREVAASHTAVRTGLV